MPYKDIEKQRAAQLKSAKRRLRKILSEFRILLGGKCVICGSTSDLEFHHKDPTQKEFGISACLSFPKEKRIKEVMKCELRCHKHHIEIHAAPHGTESKYRAGCRCADCVAEKRRYNREWTAQWRAAGKDKHRKNYKG